MHQPSVRELSGSSPQKGLYSDKLSISITNKRFVIVYKKNRYKLTKNMNLFHLVPFHSSLIPVHQQTHTPRKAIVKFLFDKRILLEQIIQNYHAEELFTKFQKLFSFNNNYKYLIMIDITQ